MISRRIILCVCLALLFVVPAYGAESTYEGEIGATGVVSTVQGDKAKFNEYGDLKSGVYGDIRLRYDSDLIFLRFKASDIGYDTQNYRMDGGMYGKFKLYFMYDELPHNFTNGARSFYSGVGTGNLTYATTPVGTSTSAWPSTFDYGILRKTVETGLQLDVAKPFYVTASFSQENRNGIKPNWVGTSPSQPFIEIPEPVDYITNIFNVEAGYAMKPFFGAVYFTYSNFENANDFLFFQNPLSAGVKDRYSLPPDNTYYKYGFRGNVQLPFNSKFSMNLANSRTKSDTNLLDSVLTTNTITNLSDSVFNGRIDTKSYNFALTSNPFELLTGRIFYSYYSRNNKSDEITYNTPALVTNELFSYHRSKYGAQMDFRLPAHFALGTAYTHVETDRGRIDIPETRDNIYAATLKWKGVDFIVPKIGYEHLRRTTNQNSDQTLEVVNYTFDVSAKRQNTFKAGVEIYPFANLSLDIDYKYKKEKYSGSPQGLQSTQSDGIDASAGYSLGTLAQLSAYIDYEKIKSYQFQLPGAVNSWGLNLRDVSYNYGVGAEVFIIPKKLTFIVQHDYMKSNGFADFTYFDVAGLTGGRTNENIDIPVYDDYRKMSYMAKIKYLPVKKLTLTAGYAYERYRYNDAQYDGYNIATQAAAATPASSRAYLTGAYAEPNYQAHVGFLGISYRY